MWKIDYFKYKNLGNRKTYIGKHTYSLIEMNTLHIIRNLNFILYRYLCTYILLRSV